MQSEMRLTKNNSYKWVILIIATVSQTCATFVTYGMGPLATFYQKEYSLSQFETGLIVSAVNIGPIFSMLVFGNLMDRYGERWIVGMGSIFLGLSVLSANATNQYLILLVILTFVGIWYGTAQPGGSSAIIKWFPNKNRGLAMGVRQTGIPIGGALASAALPFFFYKYGLPSAIITQAVVAILGGVIFLILYRDYKTNISGRETYRFVDKIKKIKNNAKLYPVFLIGITMMSLQMIIVAHLMSYLTNAINISLNLAGFFLSTALIGGMVGRIALAWISDYFFKGNRVNPLFITIVLTVIMLLNLVYSLDYLPTWGMSILCFVIGFFAIGWYSLFIVLVSERANPSFIGLTVSFALTLNQFFIVLAPSLFGLLVDFFHGYQVPFIILSVFISIGGIWLKITDSRKVKVTKSRDALNG
ncbi:MFS transporter [Peribacillus asahii]|uniref:Uncharacterized protein n=1 Tax=Peribacillus asahii TaxID=228899 RepID=A0A3Q9RPF0_9BACI|nr:MFS transporter [Peribacillus asahii]AZV44343.1 hypothetical protein BAOM_3734 [Peribacillus asahii]USK84045.1 MFS transporter [Peribacillus asahii]